jgi:hypothetical protein
MAAPATAGDGHQSTRGGLAKDRDRRLLSPVKAPLARHPQGSCGLWVAVLANKLALTAVAAAWAGQVDGGSQALA